MGDFFPDKLNATPGHRAYILLTTIPPQAVNISYENFDRVTVLTPSIILERAQLEFIRLNVRF